MVPRKWGAKIMSAFACRPILAGFIMSFGLGLAGTNPGLADSLSMQVGGSTNPPVGYIDFCHNFPDQCMARGAADAETLTDATWRELQEVNFTVNHTVSPVTDLQYYNRDEVWTLPKGYGDCEDYVLL